MSHREPLSHGFPADPWDLVLDWLPGEPNQFLFTLSTLDDGVPDARTLVLSEVSREGFFFHTDVASRKVAQIEADPHVALTVLDLDNAHQLVVQGTALRAATGEIAQAYRDRGTYLQQLAWMNTHEFAALEQSEREHRWAQFETERTHGFTQPEGWTGFVVRPSRLTFWLGSADTASRRVEYKMESDEWTATFRAG
ncbi:pyridoxamine 5'-phosphate oxidase family protein [Demequina aurantiaca]|uniref:pyridoxamine 5'-phosphate oxidase family protein n=1 Tax=Demequina aurantiaca TaxID=676200 RepID=UPI003D338D31